MTSQSSLEILHEVLDISQLLVREKKIEKQLNIIAERVQNLVTAKSVVIYLLNKTNRTLGPVICRGELSPEKGSQLPVVQLEQWHKSNTPNVVAYCASSGNIIYLRDIYSYSGYNLEDFYDLDRRTNAKTKSLIALPLTNQDGISVGVMLFLNREVDAEESSLPMALTELLKGFAALAATSIANSRYQSEKDNLFQQQLELTDSLMNENKELKDRLYQTLNVDEIIGRGKAITQIFALIEKVSSTTVTIFLNGETGTGKELIASTIHQNSPVNTGQFVAQNCAAFPPDLLESEMFGYKKGAFSGAVADKKGLILSAHNGTLFLDEIGELPLPLQAKLLRVLQEGEIRPVGSTETIKINVRVIAATNRDLAQMVQEGTFREDLYYRLNVFPITLPPLRERKDDIPVLVNYFVHKFSKQYNVEIEQITSEVMAFFQDYDFPGNVRELMNIIERAVILASQSKCINEYCLPAELKSHGKAAGLTPSIENGFEYLKDAVAKFESEYIRQCLGKNAGNQTHTARQLGLSRRTLVEKLGKYNLRRMDTNPY